MAMMKHFCVEYARTERSRCKAAACGSIIASHSVRIGRLAVSHPWDPDPRAKLVSWYHPACLLNWLQKRGNRVAHSISGASDIKGLGRLKQADQEQLKTLIYTYQQQVFGVQQKLKHPNRKRSQKLKSKPITSDPPNPNDSVLAIFQDFNVISDTSFDSQSRKRSNSSSLNRKTQKKMKAAPDPWEWKGENADSEWMAFDSDVCCALSKAQSSEDESVVKVDAQHFVDLSNLTLRRFDNLFVVQGTVRLKY